MVNRAMRVVCAWCGRVTQEGSEPTTHGMCRSCEARERADAIGDWESDLALVPTNTRAVLIVGGEPRHWEAAALALVRNVSSWLMVTCSPDGAAFDDVLPECAGGVLLLEHIERASPAQQACLRRLTDGWDASRGGPARVIAGSSRPLADVLGTALFGEDGSPPSCGWHIVLARP